MVAETSTDVVEERIAFAPVATESVFPAVNGSATIAVAPVRTEPPIPSSGLFRRSLPSVRRVATVALAAEWERGTAFLLIPVFFGAGAATNFALASEPSLPLLGAIAALSTIGTLAMGKRAAARFLLAGILIFMLGMLAASFETWRAGTKMLGSDISTRVTGRVVTVEERAGRRPRVTIDVIATERPQLRYAPDRIRVTADEISAGILPGRLVSGLVRLLPPTGPVRPDSYDFSFESYFDGIGASGFFLAGPFSAENGPEPNSLQRLGAWIENARYELAAHIRTHIGGSEGEIAAALVAGVRSGIPEDENEALRRTGLAHFLSISGLHMALVAGTIIGGLRAFFALFPAFASRYPVKKFSAIAALAAITAYLVISGAAIAAQRSFIMFAVMLVAVLFDRAALTMRNLAIAALIVLAIAPHEIMGPSFQMSFAATAALIGAYAWYAERRRARAADSGWRDMTLLRRGLQVTLLFFGGLAMTSLIAGTATGLYGAWHFQRVAPLGLFANLAAMPIVTVAVMPMAVVGMVLIPFGLDGPFFAIMGKALAAVMAIARWLSEHSPVDEVGLIPPAAVAVLSVALAIVTIATTRLRFTAIPFLLVGAALILVREMPDVLISEDGRLVAMRMSDGRIAVNRARPSAFTVENWSKALQGKGVVKPDEPLPSGVAEYPFSCRDGLCLAAHRSGAKVAFAGNAEAAKPACRSAALLVIDDATASGVCDAGSITTVITKRDLALRGSAAIRFSSGGGIADIRFAIGEGERPWHQQRRFSREARGLPPYQRPSRLEAKPAGETRPAKETDKPVSAGQQTQ